MLTLTREQIREIDRRAIEDFGMPGVVLMENAGRNAACLIVDCFQTWSKPKEPQASACARPRQPIVCIFCGPGNNGGDGFVIARHLFNEGYPVQVILLADPQKLSDDAATNYHIARKMEIPISPYHKEQTAQLIARSQIVIDALLGTGFCGQVRRTGPPGQPPMDQAIELINSANHAMKVAIDVPSGLDCDTGLPADATVKADLTITFVAAKVGFAKAADYTGQVLVADIGAPRTLLDPN